MRAPLLVLSVLVTLLGFGPARPAAALACGEADVRVQYVCATYSAVAGRQASSADLDYWVPQMPAKRTALVTALARSTEGRHLTIQRYYSRFFETVPSSADLTYWTPLVTAPNGLRKLEAALLADAPGGIEGFVQQAYGAQLGRDPLLAEVEYWGDRAEAMGKNKVAAELSNTLEVRRARVRGAYLNDLGFAPDEASRAYWAQRLATGTSYLDFRIALRASLDAYATTLACSAAAAPQFGEVCAF